MLGGVLVSGAVRCPDSLSAFAPWVQTATRSLAHLGATWLGLHTSADADVETVESLCNCDDICEALVSTTTTLPQDLSQVGASAGGLQVGGEAGSGQGTAQADVVTYPPSNVTFDAWRCDCPVSIDDVAVHAEGPFWTHTAVQPEWDLATALSSQAMHVDGEWNNTVMAMMTNVGEVDLVENLLCSLRRVGVNKYVVFATGTYRRATLPQRLRRSG
jgi:hypothetical protein